MIHKFAPVAQWIEQWFPVPCAGVRFPSGVLPGTVVRSGALYHKEDKNLDDFREWLSDNLRYFMLGGAILLIVAVLFFGIRACIGTKKGNSESDEQQTEMDNNQGNVPSSPANDGETGDGKKEEDTNPMEKNNAEVTALIASYYKALGEKDIAALKTLVDDLNPSDESKITNAKDYIEGYELGDVYTKKGLDDDSYVAYAVFNYNCKGIDTPVPALSRFYIFKDSQGNLKIDGGADDDSKISAYTDQLQSDEDVSELISDVKKQYDDAQKNDSALAEFLAGLGDDASLSVSEGTVTLTATDNCNVRAETSTDAEIIGGLSTGTQVEKKGVEGDWVQIDYEGQTGYVHSSLLE